MKKQSLNYLAKVYYDGICRKIVILNSEFKKLSKKNQILHLAKYGVLTKKDLKGL